MKYFIEMSDFEFEACKSLEGIFCHLLDLILYFLIIASDLFLCKNLF